MERHRPPLSHPTSHRPPSIAEGPAHRPGAPVLHTPAVLPGREERARNTPSGHSVQRRMPATSSCRGRRNVRGWPVDQGFVQESSRGATRSWLNGWSEAYLIRPAPTVFRLHRRYAWLRMPPGVMKMFERKHSAIGHCSVARGPQWPRCGRGRTPGGPSLRVLARVNTHARGHGFVEMGQWVVDQLVFGIGPFLGLGQHSARHGFVIAGGTGTAEGNGKLLLGHERAFHIRLLLNFQDVTH